MPEFDTTWGIPHFGQIRNIDIGLLDVISHQFTDPLETFAAFPMHVVAIGRAEKVGADSGRCLCFLRNRDFLSHGGTPSYHPLIFEFSMK